MIKKALYILGDIIAAMIAVGVGIGVAITSKVFAKFNPSGKLQDAVKEADEVIEAYAEENLTEEINKEEN